MASESSTPLRSHARKPRPDRSWQLILSPLELFDRLARFIPPPRRHLQRDHGVFAPHAASRAHVAARAGQAIAAAVALVAPGWPGSTGSGATPAPAPGSAAARSPASAPTPSIVGTPAAPEDLSPIRGPPGLDATQRREGPCTGRFERPDPPVDVMPDYEDQGQDMAR